MGKNKIVQSEEKTLESEMTKLTNYFAKPGIVNDGKSNQESKENKNNCLNCLARLITRDKNCVIVCLFEDKLFISSNAEESKNTRGYMEILARFINHSTDKEIYNQLLQLAIKKIYFYTQNNFVKFEA